MLSQLRRLPPDTKKKVALLTAGFVTLLILIGWALKSSAIFVRTYGAAREQGIAIFAFFDQNVEDVYTEFQDKLPDFNSESAIIEPEATTTATTTLNQNG